MTNRYVFIGGVGRSGTSITREIFKDHKDVISFPFEYRFLVDPDGVFDFLNYYDSNWTPFAIDKKLKSLESFLLSLAKKQKFEHFIGRCIKRSTYLRRRFTANAYHGWELNKHLPNFEKHVRNYILEIKSFVYQGAWVGSQSFQYKNQMYYVGPEERERLQEVTRRFLKQLFGDLFEGSKKSILVEDNTWNLIFADHLDTLVDNAKFIHVFRDPRDIVCSYSSQRWTPNNKLQSARMCRDLFKVIDRNTSRLSPENFLQVSVEQLTRNKAQTLQQLSNFIGIEVNDDSNLLDEKKANLERWKKDLDSKDLQNMESVLREQTESLGYRW